MQMKTRDYDDSNSQYREQTVRLVSRQIRESAMIRVSMLSSAGQKRNTALAPPAFEPCLKLTDWPVY